MRRSIYRLLLIENDQGLNRQLLDLLGQEEGVHFEIISASFDTAIEKLMEMKIELILFSMSTLEKTKIENELLHLKNLHQKISEVPIIVIHGPGDADFGEKVIADGAEDYISEIELGSRRLFYAIRYAISRHHFRWEKFNRAADIQYRSKLDSLGHLAATTADQFQPSIAMIGEQLKALKDVIPHSLKDVSSEMGTAVREVEVTIREINKIVENLMGFKDEVSTTNISNSEYRILIVEDEINYADLIIKRLKNLGYRHVDHASNGADAYNLCVKSVSEGHRYDFLISDLNMPKLSGLKLLERLRSNIYFRKIPFMMVTAINERDNIEAAIKLNVSQYLIKPFQGREFDAKIARLHYFVRS